MTIKRPANPKSIAIDVNESTASILFIYHLDTEKSGHEQKIAAAHLRAAMTRAIKNYFRQFGR